MPIDQVRALGGSMRVSGAAEGLFVSTLSYGETAKQEASKLNITLWGPKEISRIMERVSTRWGNNRRWSLWRWWLTLSPEWKQVFAPLGWLLLLLLFAAVAKLL